MLSTCSTQWKLIRILLYSALAVTVYSNCTKPEDVAIATLDPNKESYDEKEVVKFVCSEGYISKSNEATCESSTWTPPVADFCHKRDCGYPEILRDGDVEFTGTEFGANANYTCMAGYKLNGAKTRICLADGTWNKTDTLPSCNQLSCGPPEKLENGKIIVNDYLYQSIAVYVCDEGYMLVGDANKECMEDGSWSGSPPTCKRSCPNPPVASFADIIDKPDLEYFDVGIYIIYKCLAGYKYVPDQLPAIQCQEGYAWSNITKFCQKVNCRDPERIKNGNVEKTGTDFGSIATYSCNAGFNITGSSKRVCAEDGFWTGALPTCQCTVTCL